MLTLILLSIAGIIAGLFLLRIVPVIPAHTPTRVAGDSISIIIPARNEAENLPPLLESLRRSTLIPRQLFVVDDASTDMTAAVAADHGATTLTSAALPGGWTGKTWACHQGALAATSENLFFLDADTYFTPDGFASMAAHFGSLSPNTALSILPFHRMQCWYEQLSLFFNILVAIGAGGYGKLDPPQLFGQSLLIPRGLYYLAGGHAAVRHQILENLHFAGPISAAEGIPRTLSGRGTLEMRMFPDGFTQLLESWRKAFADGASLTSPLVLALSVYWLSAAMFTAMLAITFRTPTTVALYLINVAQIFWYGRQLGTFRVLTALFYPIPLAFYFGVFAQSFSLHKSQQPVTWRGRQL